MSEFVCKYCGKICKNLNSQRQHEVRCKNNPERIDLTYLEELRGRIKKHNYSNQYIKAKQDNRIIIISEETRYKYGNAWRGKKLPEEMKKHISDGIKKAIKNRPESYNGININGKVKKYKYNNISLDGTWEVDVAKLLDSKNIIWERPQKGIEYLWEGDIHLYFPDFYLPEYNNYI